MVRRKEEEEVLVLGAWGCGVFRFPPEICASLFHSLLIPPSSPFHNAFKHIVFAITDLSIVHLFEKVMSEGPLPLPAGGLTHKMNNHRSNNNNKKKKGGDKKDNSSSRNKNNGRR